MKKVAYYLLFISSLIFSLPLFSEEAEPAAETEEHKPDSPPTPAPSKGDKIRGTVKSADATTLTLDTGEYTLKADTSIKVNGKAAKATDLKSGMKITAYAETGTKTLKSVSSFDLSQIKRSPMPTPAPELKTKTDASPAEKSTEAPAKP